MNYSRVANFTPAEAQLGIGVFLSRFGKGPMGFIVFLISVSMFVFFTSLSVPWLYTLEPEIEIS